MSNQNFTLQDSSDNRGLGVVISIFSFLFFIPLVARPDSVYLKFRANQSLILFILDAAVGVIKALPLVGWVGNIIGFAVLILKIINLVNACREQNTGKPMPLVGYIEIIR